MNLFDQFILQHVQVAVLRSELVRVSREPGMQEAKVELNLTPRGVHIEVGLPKAIREEWLGSKLMFDIKENSDGSQIDFIHEGLGPQLICHDVCVEGWDHFFGNSLKDYVNASS